MTVAIILKGLPKLLKPFAIHVTQRDETISLKRNYGDTEKMHPAATDDNVMKVWMQQRARRASASDQGAKRAGVDVVCFRRGLTGHIARACHVPAKARHLGTQRAGGNKYRSIKMPYTYIYGKITHEKFPGVQDRRHRVCIPCEQRRSRDLAKEGSGG